MLVIDPSALVAILLQEQDAPELARCIEADPQPIMSAASLVELYAVMRHKQGPQSFPVIDRLLQVAGIAVHPFTPEQAILAREAGERFKVLNFGDTFSYALAKAMGAPLLFKGEDFAGTDVLRLERQSGALP